MPQVESKISSGHAQSQTSQGEPYFQNFEEDSIDLYYLWFTLWKRKWLVIALPILMATGSILYTLQLEHIYNAKALLLEPKSKDVQSMNVFALHNIYGSETELISQGYSASSVFKMFKHNLNSRSLQKKFILENGLIEFLSPETIAETTDESIYQRFTEMVKITENNQFTILSIEMNNPKLAAKWVNDFTEFIDKETIDMLVDNLHNKIANQLTEIEYSIASKRQIAKRRREDMIKRYEEAAFIAEQLGIMDRVDSTNILQNNQYNIITSNIPIYFRGYTALSTELSSLKRRKSDDPFIEGLRDLQERRALLQTIKFEKENIRSVRIDRQAFVPKSPIKPNRRLIVTLTTLVGLLSGILLAFSIEFVQREIKKHS